MPMLIPNHQSVPKSIENISKNGIDIDEVVRNSFSCAVKNSLSKFSKNTVDCITKGSQNFKQSTTTTTTTSDKNNVVNNNKTNNKALPLATRNKNYEVIVRSNKNNNDIDNDVNTCKKGIKKTLVENIKKEVCNETIQGLDDSLTSLQWLTGVKVNDLMEGKPIHYTPLSPAPSNCSDEGDERRTGRNSRYYSDSSVDYRTNSNVKPPYSYAALIIMAMKSKSCAKMTLSEIYKWITENFVFYKHAEPSWQNSIRHNLSLNKCFAKIPRNKGDPGKGGYWRIVSEYADKLLESNIRKRRSSIMDFSCQEFIKRQRHELFESQLLLKIKDEIKDEHDVNHSYKISSSHKNIYKHSSSGQHMETLADAEQCRMDHPYGKNPYSKYNVCDEENIKALADNLRKTSTTFVDPALSTSSSINFDLSNSQVFNTFSSVIRTDCIWSSEQNQSDNALTESMTRVKEELLEARNLSSNNNTLLSKTLGNSLNSSGGFTTSNFCLSPPLSGDDDTLSDDLDDDLDTPFEDLDLTVRGTSMQILSPTSEMIECSHADIKEEPLSPESIDLEE